MSPVADTVSVVAMTHRGAVRSHNEDTVAIGSWLCCKDLQRPMSFTFQLAEHETLPCLVADGLGGHNAGQLASHLAAHSLILDLWGIDAEGLQERVAASVRSANRVVYARMQDDSQLAEMGSTVAGVVLAHEELSVFNVGDSRVYRWQDGFLCQLTTDDVPESEVRTGLILQSLGGSSEFIDVDPHVVHEKWLSGRRYLICSDGLYEAVPLEAIETALREPLLTAAESLFEQAMAAGAADNVSLVLIERA
jgi:serine/threonine protein phosphatase PrpC